MKDRSTLLPFAKGKNPIALASAMANRHGLIAGATGTGKTVTLRVLAERFSDIGVPVFMADVKGDLSGLARPGEIDPSALIGPGNWASTTSTTKGIPRSSGTYSGRKGTRPAPPSRSWAPFSWAGSSTSTTPSAGS